MSGAHAKPLPRRQLRQRNRIGKWTAGVMSLLLLGGATMCALTMPGTPTALGVPDRSPTPAVTRSVGGPTVSRTSTREALADGVEAVSVDSTGTWTMGNDRIDVERLTRAAPEPTDLHHAKATEQTVDLLNDTDIPADTTTSTPAATGDSGNMYPWGSAHGGRTCAATNLVCLSDRISVTGRHGPHPQPGSVTVWTPLPRWVPSSCSPRARPAPT